MPLTLHITVCQAIELLKAFSFTQDAEPSSAAAPRAASEV